MKKKDGRWVDAHGNSWDANRWDEATATFKSTHMEGCTFCRDCDDCRDCWKCVGCLNCINCRECNNCVQCVNCESSHDSTGCELCNRIRYCQECYICNYCRDCLNCRKCSGSKKCKGCCSCTECTACTDCEGCIDCEGFESNPNRFAVVNIGSRRDTVTAYWLGTKVLINTGCFCGDLTDFEQAVDETHGDNPHGVAYRHFIEQVKGLMT